MAPLGDGGGSQDNSIDRPASAQDAVDMPFVRSPRYRMSADLAALGADFLVLNDAGEHVFRISGESMSRDDTIRIEEIQGRVLYSAPVHAARKKARIGIFDAGGNEIAAVVRKPVSPLRDRFCIEMRDGFVLSIDGNVPRHEFVINDPTVRVAEVSRKWFRARGSYGVEIEPGNEDALLLAAVLVLDQMIHDGFA